MEKISIKAFITVSLILLLSVSAIAKNRHALVIGVGEYPVSSGWSPIHGDNDVQLVKNALLRQGFLSSEIITLSNSQATKGSIISAIKEIESSVKSGDVVYIHFSGHGQQITDLNGDEKDGFDEAWIPYDAKIDYVKGIYEGENHIIDDEVYELLRNIRQKIGSNGRIIVISDACHSGSATRGRKDEFQDGEEYVRGVKDKFVIPDVSVKYDPSNEKSIEWLSVEACKSYESNHEYKSSQGFVGMLSYIISIEPIPYDSLSWNEAVSTWQSKLDELRSYPQHLVYEGAPSDLSNKLF